MCKIFLFKYFTHLKFEFKCFKTKLSLKFKINFIYNFE